MIQRRAARLITGDYKSREEGSVAKILAELELESLQSRRTSQRLILLYKVVEGLVPAIKPEDYLTKSRQRRTIKPKRFDDYVNTNIVENSVRTIQSLSTKSSVILSNIGIHSSIKLYQSGTTWRKIQLALPLLRASNLLSDTINRCSLSR